MSTALVVSQNGGQELVVRGGNAGVAEGGDQRTSRMDAPIMQLCGHTAEVYSVRFSPTGDHIASASHDRDIRIWLTSADCPNVLTIRGHSSPVLECAWTRDSSSVASASADRTVQLFDVSDGERVRKFASHSGVVNSVCTSRRSTPIVASCSDDRTARMWDARVGSRSSCVVTVRHKYAVTAVALSADDNTMFTGSIENDIVAWDLRMPPKSSSASNPNPNPNATKDGVDVDDGETDNGSDVRVRMTLRGHVDTVTGLALSNDGSYILSNAMDCELRIWDVRPFSQKPTRCLKVLQGHSHGPERTLLRCGWSRDGRHVGAGSADGLVNVWSTTTRAVVYKLPGHKGSVNDVQFSPVEPVVASCGADHTIFLGEIAI